MHRLRPVAMSQAQIAWLVLSLTCRTALAQEPAAAPTPPSSADSVTAPPASTSTPAPGVQHEADLSTATEEGRERARTLFWTAHQRYDEGSYLEAATLFEQSYALVPQPELLFNIALARARSGDCDAAWERLEDYENATNSTALSAEAPKRAHIEQYCTPAEPTAAPIGAAQDPAPSEPPPANGAKVAPPPPPRTPDAAVADRSPTTYFTPRRTLGWSFVGASVLAGGAALYLGSEYYDAYDDMEREKRDNHADAGDEMDAREVYAKRARAWGIASAIAAAAFAGAGVGLLIFGEQQTETVAGFGVDPRGAVSLEISGAF